MKTITVPINGKNVTGFVEKIDGALWVHLNGRTFLYEPAKKQSRARGKSAAASTGDALAPMPGKIIKVLAKPGDLVQTGQVLLVMEAMKMEYTLKATVGGIVAKTNCKAGDQVTLGALLVKIEPDSKGA